MASTKRSDAATLRLYKAAANYVKVKGGSVAVAGGVEIQEWPGEGEFKFRVAVRCTGRKPQVEPESQK